MMSKCIVNIGYSKYVFDTKDAVGLLEILNKAENYEEKYHGSEDGKPSYYTYHVWEQGLESSGSQFTLGMLPDGRYRIAKMAGKP
jgi:hypothetical protein